MERAMDLNIEIVREHIAGICRGAAGVGAVCVRAEGLRFELANNAVITVSPDDGNLSKTSRARSQAAIQRKNTRHDEAIPSRDIRLQPDRGGGDRTDPAAEPGAAGFDGFPEDLHP